MLYAWFIHNCISSSRSDGEGSRQNSNSCITVNVSIGAFAYTAHISLEFIFQHQRVELLRSKWEHIKYAFDRYFIWWFLFVFTSLTKRCSVFHIWTSRKSIVKIKANCIEFNFFLLMLLPSGLNLLFLYHWLQCEFHKMHQNI